MLIFLQEHQRSIILIFFGFVFYELSRLIPLFADDYCRFSDSYQFINILTEVRNDYRNWTGRFLVMFVNRSIFSLNEIGLQIVSVMNTLLFLLSARIAIKYADINTKISSTICLLGFFFFLFWFTPEVFAEVILWRTGSIQYFWGSVIALVVVYPLIRSVFEEEPSYAGWKMILYIFLCFVGGSWLENLSVAIVPVWIAILAHIKFKQGRALDRTHLYGLAAWSLGTIFLVIAPGNYVRAETINDSTSLLDNLLPVLQQIYQHLDKSLLLIYLLFSLTLLWTQAENMHRRFIQSGFSLCFLAHYFYQSPLATARYT